MNFKTYVVKKLNEDIAEQEIKDKIIAIKDILSIASNDNTYDEQIEELINDVDEEYNDDTPLIYDGKDTNGKVVLRKVVDSVDNSDFILRDAQVYPKDDSWIDYDKNSEEYETFYNVFNKLNDNPTTVKSPAFIKNWIGNKGTITNNGIVE